MKDGITNPTGKLGNSQSNDNVDLDSRTKKGDSKIATLQPYEKVSFKRNKFRSNPLLIHFDSLFGLGNWSRFLVMKTSKKISAAKLENILLSKCPTKEMSFRTIRPNEWLIETTTQSQSEAFLSLNEMEGIEVSVKRHDTLNSIQGTVILPDVDDDEVPSKLILMDSLNKRYNNVQDIEIYEIPNRKYPGNPLKIAKIKFEGQTLPQKIKILGQSREVRPFVPKPLQCKSCSKFGHTESKCRGIAVCAFCSSIDHPTKWNCGLPKCINCGLEHHARSKDCTFYIYNTELKMLVSRTGMSYKEAKLELKARGFKDPARNPVYKSKLTSIIPQKAKPNTEDVQNNHESKSLKPSLQHEIVSRNFFGVLSTTEVEIHQTDDVMDDDDNIVQLRSNNKNKVQETKQKKRTYDRLSPDKNSANQNFSVRPKIQRNSQIYEEDSGSEITKEKNTVKEILPSQSSLANFDHKLEDNRRDNVQEISPSPIYPTKFKGAMKSKPTNNHDDNCKCNDCFQNEVNTYSLTSHNSLCGCHDCFIKETSSVKPLTKEKLINIIRTFVANRNVDTDEHLDLHRPDCLCTNHLKCYKKRKIAFLDKFLNKQNNTGKLTTSEDNL